MPRIDLLDELVRAMPRARARRLVVGIDGRDGVGKTCLADELVVPLQARGEQVWRASLDGFHHLRVHRYQLGADSGKGYWRHAFDVDAIRRELLDPWRSGAGQWRTAIHDVRTDAPLHLPARPVPAAGVLLVDGVFLARPELAGQWDVLILLDAPLEVSQRRAANRDGSPAAQKYAEAHALYRATCDPVRRADVVVDATSLHDPAIVSLPHLTEDP